MNGVCLPACQPACLAKHITPPHPAYTHIRQIIYRLRYLRTGCVLPTSTIPSILCRPQRIGARDVGSAKRAELLQPPSSQVSGPLLCYRRKRSGQVRTGQDKTCQDRQNATRTHEFEHAGRKARGDVRRENGQIKWSLFRFRRTTFEFSSLERLSFFFFHFSKTRNKSVRCQPIHFGRQSTPFAMCGRISRGHIGGRPHKRAT